MQKTLVSQKQRVLDTQVSKIWPEDHVTFGRNGIRTEAEPSII